MPAFNFKTFLCKAHIKPLQLQTFGCNVFFKGVTL